MDCGTTTSHLQIEELSVGFRTLNGHRQVLELAHLHVDHGESVGLVGESGSGKSVLALTVLRLLQCPPARITASRLALDGRDILSLSEKEIRRLRGRELAMIFQDPMSSLNPVFTVGSQFANVIRRIRGEHHTDATERALEFIRLVGLPDPENMLTKYPHELSGGQRQRVIIALALCCDAKFVIADEPTRNVDVTVQAGILQTIAHLQHELGVSLLFIANNLALVSVMCDRVAILLAGRVVESGGVNEIIEDARHPYTHMLLRAVPTPEERQQVAAKSTPGGLEPLLAGAEVAERACPYYSRCLEADADCRDEAAPQMTSVGGTHEVACHRVTTRLESRA